MRNYLRMSKNCCNFALDFEKMVFKYRETKNRI